MPEVLLLLILLAASGAAGAAAADIPVADGQELARVLSGNELHGHVLDDGDTLTLTGTETVFTVPAAPDAYYKGFTFTVRTSPDRPRDKRMVTITYTGTGAADLFTMTEGEVTLSNILLENWTPHACCGPY